jgi:hypothetical protein
LNIWHIFFFSKFCFTAIKTFGGGRIPSCPVFPHPPHRPGAHEFGLWQWIIYPICKPIFIMRSFTISSLTYNSTLHNIALWRNSPSVYGTWCLHLSD